VFDGEAVALAPDGRPRPFQVTASRTSSHMDVAGQRADTPLTPFFFDLLHLDGADLIDEPAHVRHAKLAAVMPARLLVPRMVTEDIDAASAFFADAVARGHEGVVVKAPDSRYAAGRRGSEWIKVKPRHTLDLVILAAEWGRNWWSRSLSMGSRPARAIQAGWRCVLPGYCGTGRTSPRRRRTPSVRSSRSGLATTPGSPRRSSGVRPG